MTAITAEAEDPNWAVGLTPEEAERAVRHVGSHWSGFPSWLDALAKAHPDVVERVLGKELSGILAWEATAHPQSTLLQDIDLAAPDLARLFLPNLRTWFGATRGQAKDGDDAGGAARRLEQVTGILIKVGDNADRALVRKLSAAALATDIDPLMSRVWLPTLFSVDPEAAVDRLELSCSRIEVSRTSEAVTWCACLFGGLHTGRGVDLKHPDMTPSLLLRLLRLAYRHVERKKDAVHEGMFSADTRDDAETGRNAILKAVFDLEGEEGWAAKLEIADDPEFAHLRDRLRALALEKSAKEAEGPPMRPEEAARIGVGKEPAPRTSAEMFVLMMDRLDDLKNELLRDASPRALWQPVRDEHIMRRAIAHHLEVHACGAYSVAQENVTGEEKETDIRLRSSATDVEGVIELKIGDKDYSAATLRAAISKQLVKKYLAPDNRRAGCLLLTLGKPKVWQHPDTGERIGFDVLVTLLKEAASKLQGSWPAEIHVDVAGLDLTPRLGTERETAAARKSPT